MKTSDPPGSFNAHWFNFFNALSFQIMMGAPILLYAKTLGASSTVLGIIASFTPLMTVFQLPAAKFLDRFGYRTFMLMGWGLRTIMIFILAGVPLMGFLDAPSKMAVMLALLFVFNLLRGISSAAWMPWIASLIPEAGRGKFLSLDQIFMYCGCLASLAVSAVVMSGDINDWEYSLVFLISAMGGAVGLHFIKQIPEVESGDIQRGAAPVPWRAMLAYGPFRRLLAFNLIFMTVIGSLGVFTVEYLKETVGLSPAVILVLSGCSFAGAILAMPFCGAVIDRTGSKPLMRTAMIAFSLVLVGWFAMASDVVTASVAAILFLNLFAGIASAIYNLANVRIVMATMPEMGRNHFFALFTVITSLGLGATPVVWGVTLDVIGTFEATTGVFIWRQHSIYFFALFLVCILSIFAVSLLLESPSAKRQESSVVYGKLRRASRIWHR